MKRGRWIAFLCLVVAIAAMLGTGLYLSATHQGAHPVDSNSPGNASSPQR